MFPVLLGLHLVAGPEIGEPGQLGLPPHRREQVDETGAEQLGAGTYEELCEQPEVDERQRRVGEVAAHELGLIVHDGSVVRLAFAEATLRFTARRGLGQLAFGDVREW